MFNLFIDLHCYRFNKNIFRPDIVFDRSDIERLFTKILN